MTFSLNRDSVYIFLILGRHNSEWIPRHMSWTHGMMQSAPGPQAATPRCAVTFSSIGKQLMARQRQQRIVLPIVDHGRSDGMPAQCLLEAYQAKRRRERLPTNETIFVPTAQRLGCSKAYGPAAEP
jgi:hypothetical protein